MPNNYLKPQNYVLLQTLQRNPTLYSSVFSSAAQQKVASRNRPKQALYIIPENPCAEIKFHSAYRVIHVEFSDFSHRVGVTNEECCSCCFLCFRKRQPSARFISPSIHMHTPRRFWFGRERITLSRGSDRKSHNESETTCNFV